MTARAYDIPRFRIVAPWATYNGTARTEWQVFAMIGARHNAGQAHMILSSPRAEDVLTFVADCGELWQGY